MSQVEMTQHYFGREGGIGILAELFVNQDDYSTLKIYHWILLDGGTGSLMTAPTVVCPGSGNFQPSSKTTVLTHRFSCTKPLSRPENRSSRMMFD
jgi:hypothetical protein